MTKAIETLMNEHRVIEQVLESLEAYAETVRAGAPVERAALARYADFFRGFADACHHGKEEDRLFARMVEKGFPQDAGPIAVMLAEHVHGRRHVRAIAALGEGSGPLNATEREALVFHASAYVPLLREHIVKEDRILYPMAEQSLSPEELARLAEEFEEFEAKVMGEGAHARFHALAEELVAACPPGPLCVTAGSPCGGCHGGF